MRAGVKAGLLRYDYKYEEWRQKDVLLKMHIARYTADNADFELQEKLKERQKAYKDFKIEEYLKKLEEI